jgi:hypothetical protein
MLLACLLLCAVYVPNELTGKSLYSLVSRLVATDTHPVQDVCRLVGCCVNFELWIACPPACLVLAKRRIGHFSKGIDIGCLGTMLIYILASTL